MTKINLREQYPDFYKTDYIITTRRIIPWIAETELNMMRFSFP